MSPLNLAIENAAALYIEWDDEHCLLFSIQCS